jgi:hypothetical protein
VNKLVEDEWNVVYSVKFERRRFLLEESEDVRNELTLNTPSIIFQGIYAKAADALEAVEEASTRLSSGICFRY